MVSTAPPYSKLKGLIAPAGKARTCGSKVLGAYTAIAARATDYTPPGGMFVYVMLCHVT